MKKWLTALCVVGLLSNNIIYANATSVSSNSVQEIVSSTDAEDSGNDATTSLLTSTEDEVITMLPVSSKIIVRKELGTTKIPLIVTGKATVYDVIPNRPDIEATYENEVIYVNIHNITKYADNSDVIVTFKVVGIDGSFQTFETKLTITFEIENKMSLEDILKEEESIDVTHINSYDRTMLKNEYDRRLIAHSNMDFSKTTIACLGDSITEGVGVEEGTENKYSYPAELQKILGAKSVVNLGEGGTSISSYWDSFIKNVDGIPEDTNIIIVIGGINDCYSGKKENLGTLEECESGTFYGDTDFLMKELKDRFPDAQIIFGTPLATITNTSYLSFLPNMLPLYYYANAIKELAEQNDVQILDMYYDHFLDSNDENIINTYMYDGVHPNAFGYQLLAEHIAGDIIREKME